MNDTITCVPGIKVGHAHVEEALTGCTVVILEKGCVVGVDVRGGAPGSYNVTCFQGTTTVEAADAIFLAGGSWFGLDVATGIRQYLVEKGVGWDTGFGIMPCITGVIIFDLAVARHGVRPDAKLGYAAAANANSGPVAEGNVGAGIGATVGKMFGRERCMKGGVGSSGICLENGLCVGALMVVNSVGNVFDMDTGKTVAGMRREDGKGFIEVTDIASATERHHTRENTTIGIVATNAELSYKETIKMAEMAHDGIARSVRPAHTTRDGDTIYAVATRRLEVEPDFDYLAHIASEHVAKAVVRAVYTAKSVASIPGLADWSPV